MQLFSNNGSAVIAVQDLEIGDLSFELSPGAGNLFPDTSLSPDAFFMVTVEDSAGNYEIIKVTRSGGSDQLIVFPTSPAPSGTGRGQEGTLEQAFVEGSRVETRTTQGTMENFIQRDNDIIDGGTF
jgi:hypothetical protein